jgi:hypothetical protein
VLKFSDESEGNILILEARNKLTDENYKQVSIPRLEAIIREHGKARSWVRFDLNDPAFLLSVYAISDVLTGRARARHDGSGNAGVDRAGFVVASPPRRLKSRGNLLTAANPS